MRPQLGITHAITIRARLGFGGLEIGEEGGRGKGGVKGARPRCRDAKSEHSLDVGFDLGIYRAAQTHTAFN